MKKSIASQFRVVPLMKVVINFNFYERLKSEKLYEVIIMGIEGFKRRPDLSHTFLDIFQWFLIVDDFVHSRTHYFITSYTRGSSGFKIMYLRTACRLDSCRSFSSLLFAIIFEELTVNSFAITDIAA
jgi:hypothetical protein